MLFIHLIYDKSHGLAVLLAVFISFFRAYAHSGNSVRKYESAVCQIVSLSSFADEIKKSGSIYQVELVALPFQRCKSGHKRDMSLSFFRVVVCDGVSVFYSAAALGYASAEEHRLYQRSLAVAAMTNHSDILNVSCIVNLHFDPPRFVLYQSSAALPIYNIFKDRRN